MLQSLIIFSQADKLCKTQALMSQQFICLLPQKMRKLLFLFGFRVVFKETEKGKIIIRLDYSKTTGAFRSYTNQFIRPEMKAYKIACMVNMQDF